ncbi:MAG: acyl-CoA carboxylase subunit beta [Chitinophagales bacterium]|nr:acyl-CoA carboxylase subunit beta [Chitinophagales bacterium]MDW8418983.1 acyl-CoA carboxylase subunit beta [Chitinophagales bacterium]
MGNTDLQFNKNEDAMRLALSELRKVSEQVRLGGGKAAIEKHKEKGKLTARERLELLFDKNRPVMEIGELAGYGMYEEYGGCPSGGVVVQLGYVNKRLCVAVANDATVKAGAWFPITGKKNLRAQEIAMENRLPIIYLVDSAGVFLPMQDEIFPDKENFGRIFYNNSLMSAMGIPQIAAIMGSCVAGGAYLPILSDEALIVEKTGSVFLAGSYLVKSAIGEVIDNELLGGASTHCEISGVTDYKMKNDEECIKTIRNIIDKLGKPDMAGFDRAEPRPPARPSTDIYGILPENVTGQYNMHELIRCIVDEGDVVEYKAGYGKSIICCYARIDGWAVGIVANQREVVKAKKPKVSGEPGSFTTEMQFGGVIYSDSADKAARFIMNCNQKKIPLVFLQDVTGFMVGSRSEHGGIIKDGAKMVNVVSNSVVPKFTIIVGNSFGAGNYAMCGKAYGPRFIFSYPTSRIAVMGGEQAAKTLLQIQVSAMKAKGKNVSPEEEAALLKKITEKYNSTMDPKYAAARLWVDGIIDPADTRKYISMGIEAANHAPITRPFQVGVIQT